VNIADPTTSKQKRTKDEEKKAKIKATEKKMERKVERKYSNTRR
jgi:hypothetical protein